MLIGLAQERWASTRAAATVARLCDVVLVTLLGGVLASVPALLDDQDALNLRSPIAYGWMLMNGLVLLWVAPIRSTSRPRAARGRSIVLASTAIGAGLAAIAGVASVPGSSRAIYFAPTWGPEVAVALAAIGIACGLAGASVYAAHLPLHYFGAVSAAAANLVLHVDTNSPVNGGSMAVSLGALAAVAGLAPTAVIAAAGGRSRPSRDSRLRVGGTDGRN